MRVEAAGDRPTETNFRLKNEGADIVSLMVASVGAVAGLTAGFGRGGEDGPSLLVVGEESRCRRWEGRGRRCR